MKALQQWRAINKEDNGKTAQFLILLVDLYDRWQDECEYEDLDDYLEVIQKYIPGAFEMTEEPFGFKIKCDDGILAVWIYDDGEQLKLRGEITRAPQRREAP